MHLGSNIQEDVRVTPNVTVPHARGSDSPLPSCAPPQQSCVLSLSPATVHCGNCWSPNRKTGSNPTRSSTQHKAQYCVTEILFKYHQKLTKKCTTRAV